MTVLSSLLFLCRPRWVNFKPSSQCGKVGARQRFQAAGVFSALVYDAVIMLLFGR